MRGNQLAFAPTLYVDRIARRKDSYRKRSQVTLEQQCSYALIGHGAI
jgi:hypothetical protein